MARVSSVVTLAATWLLLAAAVSAIQVNIGAVTHLVGNGNVSGGVDGAGTGALLNTPNGCVFDNSGNMYFADTSNYAVRRIPAGSTTTSTWVGAIGQPGNSITGGSTRVQSPTELVLSQDGASLYLVDYALNHVFQATVGSSTTLSYFVGNSAGLQGNTDGAGTAAFLNGPWGIALKTGSVRELYVTETLGHRVRKILDTTTTILAGSATNNTGSADGTGAAASFNSPRGIAIVQSNGNMYVADTGNRKIRGVNAGGVTTTVAGDGTAGNNDGTGTAARFVSPWGLVIDSSQRFLYISDKGNNIIKRLTISSGVIDTVMGNLAIGWTNTLSSVTSMIGAPAGVCLRGTGALQPLYVTGDHSIAYATTRRTRTETMSLPSTPAPPTTTTTSGPTTTGSVVVTTMAPGNNTPMTNSPNATVPSVSAAPSLPSIVIAVATIVALLVA